MADWLMNAAEQKHLTKGRIDVFANCVYPDELNLPVFQSHIADLRQIINSELAKNGFPSDFIKDAVIELEFQHSQSQTRAIFCYPYIIDNEGRKYAPGRIIEYAYEYRFDITSARRNKQLGFFPTIWRILRG